MAEPRIQYCTTSDGVSIAYWTMGEGLALVYLPYATQGHLQADWQRPEMRQWYERLIERWRLIRYDGRGTGLSQRDVADYSVDAWGLDLEAVVDHLGLEQIALFAPGASGAVAIAYAVRHPERVSNLILFGAWVRESDLLPPAPQLRAVRTLMEQDWELFTETHAHVRLGWSAGEEARRAAAYMREAITPDALRRIMEARAEIDVSNLLPQVRSPTLILHSRQSAILRVDVARELASRIPGASLALIEGTSSVSSSLYDSDAAFAAIEELLSQEPGAPGTPATPPSPRDVVTILFTDLASSTALTQRLGDAKLHEIRRVHNTIVRDALAAHAGTEIKHTGDGIMASFASASGALECAIAVQRGVAERDDANLGVHIGLNAGEPIADERDLFGTSVDLARRICDHAEASEILVSDVVRQLAAGKDFLFSDRGAADLKGFDEPVRLFEVRWREE